MGKKNKKGQYKPAGTPAEVLHGMTTVAMRARDLDDDATEDGFPTLVTKPEGKKRLDEVRLRRSKKFSGEVEDIVKTAPKPYEDYSPNAAINMTDDAMSKVREGKFKKALEKKNDAVIEDLVDAFLNMDKSLPNFKRVTDAVAKLIRVGKSFYEYSGDKEYISNSVYDRVLAKYRGYGFDEPAGIVPSTSKGKVGIKYPTLHNNMDKAYVIRSGEQIPIGVKETTKLEDWLISAYKVLGISSETEADLEISPKIDGVSVNGTIKGGGKHDRLSDPQTRGDETESMRVVGMNNIQVGDGTAESDFGIQYEAFVTDEDRIAAAEYLKLDKPYASNRHAAAGLINRLCTKEDDELLQFISLYPIEAAGLTATYAERMDYLSNFEIVPSDMISRKIIKGNLKTLLDKIEKYFHKLEAKREELSFAIDGIVITFVDDDYQKTLGRSSRTNQYQIGLKFDPENAEATVTGIHLDYGKKGFRTVQVDLEHPVFLGGVRYDHVPVLSAALYEDLGLRVGTKVNVHRVGDVIPSITVISKGDGKKLKLPNICPTCGHELVIKNKKLYCSNVECESNLIGRIVGFISGLNMLGYSDAFAEDIIDKCGVKELADLFTLTEEKLEECGITGKIEKKFLSALKDAVRATEDYKIIGAMGIPDIGPARAKMILSAVGGWNTFANEIIEAKWRKSFQCDAKLVMASAKRYYSKDALATITDDKTLGRLVKAIRPFVENITEKFDLLWLGHTGITPNDAIKAICKANNIEVVDGKSFDMLITGSLESNSDKMQIAKKKNLPVYTESTFVQQYFI